MNEVELKSESTSLVEQSTELVLFSSGDNESANNLLKSVKSAIKDVKIFFDPLVESAFKTHKELTSKRKTYLDPLSTAKSRIESKQSEYFTKLREKREAEERAIREEAEKKEKERLAEIAEREEELKKAEGYLSPEQQEAERKRIEELEKKDFTPVIEKVKEEKAAGQIVKERWSAEVVNFTILPDKYKLPDMQMLNTLARAEKDNAKVPGVKFTKRLSVETRI